MSSALEPRSRAQLLATWSQSQGFDDDKALSPTKAVETRSWVRTLGGADPYFALFARGVPVGRKKIDAAVRKGQIRIVPAVRGCMYLVAKKHVDLALNLSKQQQLRRLERDLEKAKAPKGSMTKVTKAVLASLADQPMTTAELRAANEKTVVSFGPAGKKVGLSSSLPPALRLLEWEGAIERTPTGGALDTESYQWSLRQTPLETIDDDAAARAIAKLFFAHHGPASFDEFVAWSGLNKGPARAAIEACKLERVGAIGHDGEVTERLAFAKQLAATSKLVRAKGVRLLGLQDLYLVVHGGPAWATPAEALDIEIPRWGPMRGGPIRDTKHPHLRAVVVDGELAGFWDVDATMQVQHLSWVTKVSAANKKLAAKKLTQLREFMRDELGHAKTFSIDSDKRIDQRLELVRSLGN